MSMAAPIWCRFERHCVWRAFSRAVAKTGKRRLARMEMIAITTSSSIRVKPRDFLLIFVTTLLSQVERRPPPDVPVRGRRIQDPTLAGAAHPLLAPNAGDRRDAVSRQFDADCGDRLVERVFRQPLGRIQGDLVELDRAVDRLLLQTRILLF